MVPRVQKIKIRNLTLNRLLFIEFVKKMVYLGAHYSERQGTNGIHTYINSCPTDSSFFLKLCNITSTCIGVIAIWTHEE